MACTENKKTIKEAVTNIENTQEKKETGNQKFWKNFSAHCNKTFEGRITSEVVPKDFKDQQLVMHVLDCNSKQILVPFNVGENRSRTWLFSLKEDLITLKHDHRHEDGSKDEITMYGGTTPNSGFETIAVFPADQETMDRIPYAGTNLWWVTLNETHFTYNLIRVGNTSPITVSFDLTKPIETPLKSWGWEDYVGG
jgi:hypothetical protein